MSSQTLSEFICQRCGGELKQEHPIYVCSHCHRKWENLSVTSYETVLSALGEQRKKDLATLKQNLYKEVMKENVSCRETERLCHKILDLDNQDMYAKFYLAACQEDESIGDVLNELYEEEYSEDIPTFLKYLITALQPKWILPIGNFIEAYYEDKKGKEKGEAHDKIRTLFEDKAEQVQKGVFDPRIPRTFFIAFSSKDQKEAAELVKSLEKSGFSCYYSPRNLMHGNNAKEHYLPDLYTAIDNCEALIFVSSSNSRNGACDAYTVELPYIEKNRKKMHRIEYLIERYRGDAIEAYFKKFFEDREQCGSIGKIISLFSEYQKKKIPKFKSKATSAPKQKSKSKLLPILLILAVIGFAGASGYFIRGNLDSTETTTSSTMQPIASSTQTTSESTIQTTTPTTSTPQTTTPTTTTSQTTTQTTSTSQTTTTAQVPTVPTTNPNFEYRGTVLLEYTGSSSHVEIPEGTTMIGNEAFYNKPSLTSVTIPDSVTSIGDYAFYYCSKLTNIHIPDSVTSIGKHAFSSCSNLTSVTIPDSVTSIGDFAFFGCTNLTNLHIPDSVTSIGKHAFSSCSNLTSIHIPKSVTFIDSAAFNGIPSITVAEDNKHYRMIDGNLYTKDGKILHTYVASNPRTSFTIPDSVTSIGNHAFHSCRNLTSIDIPDSVTSISDYAFFVCLNLTSINIPDSVTSIGDSAFFGCTNLTSISIPKSVTSVGKQAFGVCLSLQTIAVEATEAETANWHYNWKGANCSAQVIYGAS